MELMDTAPDPPHTVRIKRKRDEAPLSALLIDEKKTAKKSRKNGYVFKLAGTFEQEPAIDANVLLDSEPNKSKVFRLPKKKDQALQQQQQTQQIHEDAEVSKSLTEMVYSYLEIEQQSPKSPSQKQPTSDTAEIPSKTQGQVVPDTTTSDAEIEDYVYDIYYREKITDSNSSTLDRSSVGLIMIDSDDDLVADDESTHLTDDEDSNAEDYYANDYPDEEDFGLGSENDSIDSEQEDSDDDDDIFGDRGNNQYRHEKIPDELREGRMYLGGLHNQDDEDDFNPSDGDEGNYSSSNSMNQHSPRGLEVEWSEDEDGEQYRDRLLGKLERQVRDF